MRKIIFSFIGAVIIIGAVEFNISISSRGESMSDLALANIEALARGETGSDCTTGCKQVGWGWDQIWRCDCTYTGILSSCDSWGC